MTKPLGPVAWRTRAEDGIGWHYFSFEGNAIKYHEATGKVVEPLYLEQQSEEHMSEGTGVEGAALLKLEARQAPTRQHYLLCDDAGIKIVIGVVDEEHAALIVAAVNAYQPDRDALLKEAMTGLAELVEAVTDEVNVNGAGGFLLARLSDARDLLTRLRAQAEGGG